MAARSSKTKQDLGWLRATCLALPSTTEDLKWGADVVFSVGDKMYCAAGATGAGYSFRAEPPVQEALIQRPNIVFAPYLGKHGWVRVEAWDAIEPAEAERLLAVSYRLVLSKLPKRRQRELNPAGALE